MQRPSEALSPPEEVARTVRRSRWVHLIAHNVPLLLVLVILLGMVVGYGALFYASQRRLPGNFELTSVVDNTMPLAMAAVGQTVVVLTRGIDLSVGGMVDITNSLAAVAMRNTPGSMVGVTVVVLAIGAAAGLANGLLVAVGRLQPILVTLATLSIFQGIALRILPQPGGAIPPVYTAGLANTRAPISLAYVALLIAFWYAFRRTPLGVAILAIGNDEHAARAHGINVVRTRVLAYALGGVFAAAAGLFLAATTTAGDATTGNGYTLLSIAAAALGGVNLFGGRGSAVGAVAGAFVLSMLVNVLFFAHIDPLYQSFYQGLFLVLAIVISTLVGVYLRR